jgi:hypothetical protein
MEGGGMTAPAFDTQQFVKQLVESGLSQDQAEAHMKALQEALAPLAAKSLNKLDSTDYENIYLQVRNRGWRWFAAVAAFFGAATVIGAISTVYISASRSVDRYVNTETFKSQVVSTALSRIANLDERLSNAERRVLDVEKHVGAVGNLPLSVTGHGLMMTDKNGNTFYVETGTAKSGDKIVFSSPFRSRPTFFIQPSGGVLRSEDSPMTMRDYRTQQQLDLQEYGLNGLNGKPALFGFLPDERSGVRIRGERLSRTYDWIAIGR